MKLITILIFYISITHPSTARRLRRVSQREEENLENQHRNAICCAKKMRCCTKPAHRPIEIRAVLVRCPNMNPDKGSSITRLMNKPVVTENEHSIKSFQGFDEDEPLIQSKVTQCRRKVIMTLKLQHSGSVNRKNQYIVIDHVYDPVTEKRVRLLNPYVINLREGQVSKSYHLQFLDYVNSEAYEQIYNKQDHHYAGCYAEKLHSTCGVVKYDGKIIPYSGGFCCSCDAMKNAERQPDSVNEKNEAIISYSDPSYLLDRVQCPRQREDKPNNENYTQPAKPLLHEISPSKRLQQITYSGKNPLPVAIVPSHKYLKPDTGFKRKRHNRDLQIEPGDNGDAKFKRSIRLEDYFRRVPLNFRKRNHRTYIEDVKRAHTAFPQSYIDQIADTFGEDIFAKRLIRKIRQTFPSGMQKRGMQNCADRYTPPGLDPEHYHESAHCLRFSDVWYGIYKLGKPFVEHAVWMNIYERFESETSSDRWREITNQTLHISNRNSIYEDSIPTISITFASKALNDTDDELRHMNSKRILIPEGLKHCDLEKHPEVKNGAEEYLVVNPAQIAVEGDQCDRIGVGFEAFFKQPLRCGVPKGTCLGNQPKHLWRHDKSLERHGEKGCYFLKYHANFTKDPILFNEITGEKSLQLEYRGGQITTIDIEIKADFNAIIRQQTTAVISEVYVDSTCDKVTTIIIKVINSGLVSNRFMVQLSDFPLEISPDFSRIKSKLRQIPPQNQHIYTLEVRHLLPSDLLFCSVEVLNSNHELVALRRIKIQKFDRCICTWHCLCACVASSVGLKCNPMSLEHYHAAGFQGSLPMVTYMVHFTLLDDLLSVVFYFVLFLLVVLLLMGLLKALLGYCFYFVGMWGLTVLLDLPKRMKKYYEPSLRHEPVMYDREGWPIHPTTKKRVRNISHSTEFCTNLVFFFTYPLAGCLVIFRRLCTSYYTKKMNSEYQQSSASTQSMRAISDTTSSGSENELPDMANIPNSDSETPNDTTVGRLAVKGKISEISGDDKGKSEMGMKSEDQSRSTQRLECGAPEIPEQSSEEELLSTGAYYTATISKTPKKQKGKKSSLSKRPSKSCRTPMSPASSRTSVSSASSTSSNLTKTSSHCSKCSSKTITTLTTSSISEVSPRKHKGAELMIPEREDDDYCSTTISTDKPKSM